MKLDAGGNILDGPITEYLTERAEDGFWFTLKLFIPNVKVTKLEGVTAEHLDLLVGKKTREQIIKDVVASSHAGGKDD